MSKPYWLLDNLCTRPGSAIAARTAASAYPADNLRRESLFPPWRSDDRAVVLDGLGEYAHTADHADFDISGDLTIEFLARPENLDSGSRWLVHKLGAADGYGVRQNGAELILALNGAVTITTTGGALSAHWGRFRIVYRAATASVAIWRNGQLIALADNAGQSGCVLSGTIPGAIAANGVRLTFGANAAGAECFTGGLAYGAIAAVAADDAGWLSPQSCRGYWRFEAVPTPDLSGRGHTLTAVGLDAGNIVSCCAAHWLSIAGAGESVDSLFVDRRHNLSTGAHIELWRGLPDDAPELITDVAVQAGQAIVISFAPESGGMFTLVIDDPGNAEGFLQIAHLCLGRRRNMSRSFLRGFTGERFVEGVLSADGAGGVVVYPRSCGLQRLRVRFRLLPEERELLESVGVRLASGKLLVFCPDAAEPERAWLMRSENPLVNSFTHIHGTTSFVDLALAEVGT